MFLTYVGSTPGKTEKVHPEGTEESARLWAKAQVLIAGAKRESCMASIFDEMKGEVVSGFATSDLREKLKEFKQIEILPPAKSPSRSGVGRNPHGPGDEL